MLRLRNLYLIGGSLLAGSIAYYTDPDGGALTAAMAVAVLVGIIGVAFAHLGRKSVADYKEADMQKLFAKASESPTGAGLALIALSIIFASLLMLFGSRAHAGTQDPRTYIPPAAAAYIPMLSAKQRQHWPDHLAPHVLAGLVEQETCITLNHKSCWSPTARLKSAREEGAGLGQITRAYHASGSLRFDALQEARNRHPEPLIELTWGSVYRRPDLQLSALVLTSKDVYAQVRRVIADPQNALAFADAAYNGGLGGVQSDRRACHLKTGCNPQEWFGHVEHTCTKSRQPLYGNKSACAINREHVYNVLKVRSQKYQALMVS